MTWGLLGQAAGMFAVTNIDDLLVLAVFFGQAGGSRGGARRVVIGQYLGFAGILAAAVAGALGAGLLPGRAVPYLGLVPLALGCAQPSRPGRSTAPAATTSRPAPAPDPASRR